MTHAHPGSLAGTVSQFPSNKRLKLSFGLRSDNAVRVRPRPILKSAKHDKRIHVLIFESESHNAIQTVLRTVSKVLPANVNTLVYQVDDTLFRLVLSSLREGVSLSSGYGKK